MRRRFERVWIVPLLLAVAAQTAAAPLWELRGTTNEIRLLGSIHFLRPADYPLPRPVDRAFRDAEVIVMELNLADLDPVDAAATMKRLAIDRRGRDLRDALGAAGWQNARRKAAEVDIDLETLRAYEPWYAALQVTQIRLQQLGFNAGFGIESQFTLRAAQDRKQVRGLETMEEQLTALDSLSPGAQKVFLLQTLDDAAEISGDLDRIVAAWRAGDAKTLEKELLDGLREQPDLYDRILRRRNRNWSRQIAALANEADDYLIIVGALHLVGEDSVLRMLEEKGLPSRQIR